MSYDFALFFSNPRSRENRIRARAADAVANLNAQTPYNAQLTAHAAPAAAGLFAQTESQARLTAVADSAVVSFHADSTAAGQFAVLAAVAADAVATFNAQTPYNIRATMVADSAVCSLHAVQIATAQNAVLTVVAASAICSLHADSGQPIPAGDFAIRAGLRDVVLAEDFSDQASVDNYISHNNIWTTDTGLYPTAGDLRRRWNWVNPVSHPDASLLLPWHKGALEIIVNGTDGQSSALWQRRANQNFTQFLHGYCPPPYVAAPGVNPGDPMVNKNEWWYEFSFFMSTDDYLKYWDTTESPGETKHSIFDKAYKQSTVMQTVVHNNGYRNMPNIYWGRFPPYNYFDTSGGAVPSPGDSGNWRMEPGVQHRFKTTHPAGLDPSALNPDGPWETGPYNAANVTPNPLLYEDASGTSSLNKRVRYGGLYRNLHPNGNGPSGSDTGYSGAFMYSRDAGGRHIRYQVHTVMLGWDPVDAPIGSNIVELFVAKQDGDFMYLGGNNRAILSRETDAYSGEGCDAYGNPGVVDPSGQADQSHHPNGLTLQLYSSGRISGGTQLNPSYPANTPQKGIYAEAFNREGRVSMPAPGWVSVGGPVSRLALPTFLPSALHRARLSTATNGRPRIIDANPSDWGGPGGIDVTSTGSGYNSLPTFFPYTTVAWDGDKHACYWWAASGHAEGFNPGIFRLGLDGLNLPEGWTLEDITPYTTAHADLDATAANAALVSHSDGPSATRNGTDGRPAAAHCYNGVVKCLDKRLARVGGATNKVGGFDPHLYLYDLGSKSTSGYRRYSPGFSAQLGFAMVVDRKWNHLIMMSFEQGEYRIMDLGGESFIGGLHNTLSQCTNGGNGTGIGWDYTRNRGINVGAFSAGARRMFTYNGVTGTLSVTNVVFSGPGAATLNAIQIPATTYSQARDRYYCVNLDCPVDGNNVNYGRWLWEIHPTTFDVQQYDLFATGPLTEDSTNGQGAGGQWNDPSRYGYHLIGELEQWPNHIGLVDKAGNGPMIIGLP